MLCSLIFNYIRDCFCNNSYSQKLLRNEESRVRYRACIVKIWTCLSEFAISSNFSRIKGERERARKSEEQRRRERERKREGERWERRGCMEEERMIAMVMLCLLNDLSGIFQWFYFLKRTIFKNPEYEYIQLPCYRQDVIQFQSLNGLWKFL